MIFLIDFENVKDNGLAGARFLQPNDELIIFYSDSAPNLEAQIAEDIKKSNCALSAYKLKTAGKNALDFYITTKLGEIFGKGYTGVAIIVSNDSGFKAVRDFWTNCSETQHRVFVSKDIQSGIISANENSDRTKLLTQKAKKINIDKFYNEYVQSKPITKLNTLFKNTEYSTYVNTIDAMLKTNKTNKEIYLSFLHQFGKKEGLSIYKILKDNFLMLS